MIANIDNISNQLKNLDKIHAKLNFQMGGSKLQFGSDNPILYSKLTSLTNNIRTNDNTLENLNYIKGFNNSFDNAFKEMKNITNSILVELIKANNSTNTTNDLDVMANNLENLKDSLLNLSNTKFNNEYIFSGNTTNKKPFSNDLEYVGSNELKKSQVDIDKYKEVGVSGLEAFYFIKDKVYKNETITFEKNDILIDQDENQWKIDFDNNKITNSNWNGTISEIDFQVVDNKFQFNIPNENGKSFEVRQNIFHTLNKTINDLKGLDENGNKIFTDNAKDLEYRLNSLNSSIENINKFSDTNILNHSILGNRNKVIEDQINRISNKNLNLKTTKSELGDSNLVEVTMKLKELEITYASLYSTINRIHELSLVKFLNR